MIKQVSQLVSRVGLSAQFALMVNAERRQASLTGE